MRRPITTLVIMSLVGSLVFASPASQAPSAEAEVATFPDGTEVEVTIDSPPDGSSPVDGRADLEGTARVGAGDTPRDTSLVVVYDLSGSTLDPAGGDCGGDTNGDGRSNTILDCEIAAMEALEQTALALGSVAEMGVVLFELGSAAADVQPAAGVQRLTEPGADLNGNDITDIAEVVRTSRWTSGWFSADATVSLFTFFDAGTGNGGTNYSAGLSRACETLAATSQPNRTIVFLSDGGANRGSDVTTVLPCSQPATVHSVAVGANSTCAADPSGRGSLQEVADLTGGTCTEVISPEDLPDILSGIISPEIYRLGLSVNGGPEVDISDTTSVPLPARGPDPLDWATTVENLAGPVDEVCVTVYARRDLELVEATECITLVSDRPPVADAGPDQTVPEGSLVELDGTGSFDPDDDPLSYRWEIVSQSGAPIVLSSTTEPVAAFIAFDDGEYELQLTVSDGRTAVSDVTTVEVTNADPVASGLAEPASEGGVALITASFTDPGILDTHTATIDWGDGGGAEPVAISAQGNGWGSLFATHVYGGPGSFTAVITVTDDDGGTDLVESVSVEVRDSLALWANSETAGRTIDWRGGAGTVEGLVHSNNDIRARGAAKTFDGPVEYVGSVSASNQVTFTQAPQQTTPEDFPVRFELDDYRPGGRAAVDAGASYFDMSGECGNRWDPDGPLASGLYYAPCDVKLNSSALDGTVTIAAEGDIQVSGSSADFSPFIDGLLFISGSSADKAVQVSASNSTFLGYLFTDAGRVDLAGSGNTYLCGILADRIDITDSGLSIRASDCIRPERTVAPPSLVPDLALDVEVAPDDVIPGDSAATTTTVTNTGALLLVPGVVGLENLGDAAVTVTSIDVGIEYLPVGGAWTPLAEPLTVSAQPNPAPGVTYPTGPEPFAGTVIGPDGLATWGVEVQADLPAATVAFLLDDTQVAAVRNVFAYELDNPIGEPVRGLFRFGNDFGDELRGLGGSLSEVRVVTTATDGTTAIVDDAAEPALASLAPGEAAVVTLDAAVAVPEPRGAIEPLESYRDRLAALDETELFGSAFALSTGGVGTVLGPFDFDSTVRHLPIVGLAMTGPDVLVAGDNAAYELEVRNTGSTDAVSVATDLAVDGVAVPVTGLSAELAPGVIETADVDYAVPVDQPVGFLDAEAATTWQDANGNDYGDVTAEVTTEIGSPPDLAALLADDLFDDADSSGLPSAGDTIRYTATITNRGTTPAAGVSFDAVPDPASTLVVGSVTTSQGTVTVGNTAGDAAVSIDVGALAPMTSAEISFLAVIEPGATELSVQGLVTSDDLPDVVTDDPAEPGSSDPTVTRVVETPPSLQAVLAGRLGIDGDGDDLIGPGDTVDYEVQVTNAGLTAATNVVVTVEADPNTALVVGSVEVSGADVIEGNDPGDTRVVVSFASLAGLTQSIIRYQVVVNDPLPDGTTEISAQGTVASDQLPDVLTDDPTVGGTADPTVLGVVTGTGGTGGPGDPGGGGPAPTFDAVDPTDGAVVTEPIAVTAGITAPEGTTIESWQVVAYPAGGDPATGIVLASGTGDPPSGPIATFDPTVVSNGSWVIQVSATDSDGGVGTSQTTVTVEGSLKLGRYAVTYLDASVSVGGIPMRVQRTYDTVARTKTADFGYGWSLDVANFEVATNRPLGEGPWSAESCGAGLIFVPLCFSTETPRLVNVTWPSGRVESFELKPTGNTFFAILMSAAYEPRPGTTSELRPAPGDETGGLGAGGAMRSGPFGSGPVYDPQRFVLVAADGTEYLLDRDDGLIQATDRYGNTVTYTDAGIVSSLGPALTFTRDAEGRIVTLTEPTGDTVQYTYDAAGDLVSVVDQAGNETTFAYDTGHYLTVIDDAGPGPFRTLNYGPDGRVESITDAEGNTTAVAVDVDARTQIVTAPDGQSTRVTAFDSRGNPTSIDHVYDGVSHVTQLTYDANDRATSRTDPLGNTWSVDWDDSGNLTSFTDPTGARTTYAYGEFNLPVAIVDAAGYARTFEYDSVGNLVAVNHPVGATSGAGPSPLQAGAGGRETFTYDAAGNLLTRTDALGATWTWQYDGNGNIVQVTDPLGQAIDYTYDGAGRLLSETDAEGAVTAYTYDGIGNLTSVTDPLGRVTSWEYDTRDNATATVDPTGQRTTYTYDDLGSLTSETDPTGRTWSYGYAFGRLVSATAPDSAITTYAYDAAGRLARLTDPLGRETEYGYDTAGRWVSTTYPFGDGQTATTTNALDAAGYRVGYSDGLGNTWTYTRDAMARVIETTNPLGESFRTDFDGLGRPLRLIDELGNPTSYSWDAAGHLTSIVAADGGVRSFEYDLVGNQVAVVDAIGRRTTFDYDGAYRHVATTDPAGNVATNTYDLAGQLLSDTTLAGVTTTLGYDARGLVTSITDGLGNTTTFGYDAAGRRTSRIDPLGHQTTYGYGPAGRPTTTTDELGGMASLEYDLAGQIVAVVDPGGNRRVFEYDDAGMVATQTDPLGRSWQFEHDAEAQLRTMLDPRGVLIQYDYDDAGRLITETAPSETISHVYDQAGQRTSMIDATGTTVWRYDDVGRLVAVETAAGDVSYAYDLAGQLTGLIQPEGATAYTYDPTGYLVDVTDWNGNVAAVTTDPDGRLTSIDRPNGVGTTYTHDAAGRLAAVRHVGIGGDVATYDYLLDANGNRTQVTVDDGTGSRVEQYGYDDLDRLVSVDYGDGVTESYGYDAIGNRTQRVVTGGPSAGTNTYTYDAAQQLTSVTGPGGTAGRTYDAAGNLLDDGQGGVFAWDDFGQLSGATVGGVTQTYAYDGDGVRVGVDGEGQVWDRIGSVPRLVSDGDGGYVHLGGQILSETDGAGTRWPLSDALGSVRTVTDATGATTTSIAYEVFGEVRSVTGPTPAFGFTSEQTDATGLTYLRARTYDPDAGRFLSPDSLQPNAPGTQGWNLYGYANANPTTFIDPTGHGALVEYASLLRNSVVAQVALRLLGLCIKGILEGIAVGLLFADIFGYDYELEWEWALVDCAIEIIFAGFGPNGGPRPKKPPKPDPPTPKPDPPRPKGPDAPPGPRPRGDGPPKGPDGPPPPRDPDAPPRPRDPDAPTRPKDPACGSNSFVAGTEVVMADGSTRPIDAIEVGDEVMATDPETGETGARAVTAVIVGEGVKHLVDIEVDGHTLTATAGHRFWVTDDGAWVDAVDLGAGDALVGTDGSTTPVEGVGSRTELMRVHNLTVEGIHTYFVAVDDAEVLSHNCVDLDALSQAGRATTKGKGGLTDAGRAYQKHMGRGELPHVPGRQLDQAGQNLLDDILTNPGSRIEPVTSGNFAGGTRVIGPDGVGVTFDANGVLQYFGVGY